MKFAGPTTRGVEYLLGGERSWWRQWYHGCRHGSPFVAGHTITLMVATGALLALGVPAAPLATAAVAIGGSAAIGAIPHYGESCHSAGFFIIQRAIAGHVYDVFDATTGAWRRIDVETPVIDLHIDTKRLRAAMHGTSRAEIPARFAELLGQALPSVLVQVREQMAVYGTDVARLFTYLHPRYLGDAARCATTVELHEAVDSRRRGWRWLTGLLRWSANGLRLTQIMTNVLFRPVQRWLRTYPEVSYILLPADLDAIERSLQDPVNS